MSTRSCPGLVAASVSEWTGDAIDSLTLDRTGGAHKYAFMRTTIDLPDPLFKEAKAVAALRDQTLKDMVVRALQRELRDGRSAPARRPSGRAALPTLACKGDFVIQPTKAQLDDVV